MKPSQCEVGGRSRGALYNYVWMALRKKLVLKNFQGVNIKQWNIKKNKNLWIKCLWINNNLWKCHCVKTCCAAPWWFAVCVGPLGFLVFLSLKVSNLQYNIISFNISNRARSDSELYVNLIGRLYNWLYTIILTKLLPYILAYL